ncbi:MAG: OmpA family protein [Cyclobacteriaceae bacterium]|nr:OmpA family protein [Cyclobacteriaceae bacterium]
MKFILALTPGFIFLFLQPARAQVRTVSSDTEWSKQQVVLTNTIEADYIIRVGDADNLNFGWPEDFDPFCGRMTQAHPYPWEPVATDLPGFDRILMSSKYKPGKATPCDGDGYSFAYNAVTSKPVPWKIPTTVLKGATIQNAYLQIFMDDFQPLTFCSKYQMLLNGKRFIEGERILNAIDQTGPVGKLVSIPLNEEYYNVLATGEGITVLIDEATGSADGFAIDFIRLLVNRKRENSCKGTIDGRVLIKGTETPIAGAQVYTVDKVTVKTNAQGEFTIKDIPTGFEVISASASGYSDGSGPADIGEGNDNPEVLIYLEKGKTANFDNKQVKVGEAITLNNILFDQGKSDIKAESKPELEKVVAFLKANPSAQIELSGHTSSEGERNYNKSLSYQRVRACKDYIVKAGIAEDRLVAVGYGPDRPVATNDTPAGRTLNRRVEMRITSL